MLITVIFFWQDRSLETNILIRLKANKISTLNYIYNKNLQYQGINFVINTITRSIEAHVFSLALCTFS